MRTWWHAYGIGACAALLVLATGGPARAHAILMNSVPAVDAHVAAGRTRVDFTYNSLIDVGRSRLDLVTPGGGTSRLRLSAAPRGDGFTAEVALTPGPAELRWQVLALDGHVTRGIVPFTVDTQDRSPPVGH